MEKQLFKTPPASFKNSPFWSVNDKLKLEECERQLEEMNAQGWGNFIFHSRVGLVTGYLSEKWMELIKKSTEKAAEQGNDFWLYDEDKWPSGFAGGKTFEGDLKGDYRARALCLIEKHQKDENRDFPDDVLAEFECDGKEYYIVRRIDNMGNAWFNGTCYVDLLNAEAVDHFIQITHQKYKDSLGELWGEKVKGIFTDEPCYLFMGSPWNAPFLPWTDAFPEFFKEIWGYDIAEKLHELFFAEGTYKQTRFNFYYALTRLFVKSFTKQYGDWCEQNGVKMIGHLMAEDDFNETTKWLGSTMPHYEHMGYPGIDKLGYHTNQWVTVKQMSSVADQMGKERALSEVFGCIGQEKDFSDRKWIGDWESALGVNFQNSHLTLYSMRGERKRDYPCNFTWAQPWWEKEHVYADYVTRQSYALTLGKRKTDILVIHPISSYWCEFKWGGHDNGEIMDAYFHPFNHLSKQLIDNHLDFHYGDEIVMEDHARINEENKTIVIGQHEYHTVVVPNVQTLSKNTISILSDFAKLAGDNRVIWAEDMPTLVDGKPQQTEKFGTFGEEVIAKLDSLYDTRLRLTGYGGKNVPEIITHERVLEDGTELIFFANTDRTNQHRARIAIQTDKSPYILDLATGEQYRAPFRRYGDTIHMGYTFLPKGSFLLLLDAPYVRAESAPAALDTGVLTHVFKKTPKVVKPTSFTATDPNTLVLNYASVTLGDEKRTDDALLAWIWHARNGRKAGFYQQPDGTPFTAEYKFTVDSVPSGKLFATIETASNLDEILVNGTKVSASGTFWQDNAWEKVDITGKLVKGTNTIKIEGKKVNNVVNDGCHVRVDDFENHKPTEIDAINIVGDFGVKYKNGRGIITAKSASSDSYPTYAGKMEYTFSVKAPASEMSFPNATAACVELFVDGKSFGTQIMKPFIFDISSLKKGEHNVKAVAYTSLYNLTGPTWIKGIRNFEYVAPHTFLEDNRFTDTPEFLEYGIKTAEIR